MRSRVRVRRVRRILCVFPRYAPSFGTFQHSYELTDGDPAKIGIVTFVVAIPMVLLAPLGGVLADRMDRRRLIAGCQAILLVTEGAPIAGGLIGAGTQLTWPRPTRPGDRLRVVSEVTAVTPSRSKPDRGMVTLRSETLNQNDEVVQILVSTLMVPRRPGAGGQGGMERSAPCSAA